MILNDEQVTFNIFWIKETDGDILCMGFRTSEQLDKFIENEKLQLGDYAITVGMVVQTFESNKDFWTTYKRIYKL